MIEQERNAAKRDRFSMEVRKQEMRKLEATRGSIKSVWFGFATFGLIGWSVVLPALGATTLGIWLDKKYPMSFSWTLTLLFTGLFVGCFNAWRWIEKEDEQMKKQKLKEEK